MNISQRTGRICIALSTPLIFACAAPYAAAATRTVSIEELTYRPATVTARIGDVVVWRNTDLVPHTVTAQGRQFDSGDLPPGKTWRYKVTKKGRYPYICTYHPTMHGVLVVR